MRGLGFSLIEVLSPCPTIWKMSPVEAQRWVRDAMEKTFPLGVFCDRTRDAQPRPAPEPAPELDGLPKILDLEIDDPPLPKTTADPLRQAQGRLSTLSDCLGRTPVAQDDNHEIDLGIRIAGFGGQGVLLLGEVMAEAGLDAGLEVSWLPSYGPEMRSGTSNCHVRIAREPIDSPLVTTPDVLVAMNEPSLRKFETAVRPGGWVIYNGDSFPEEYAREDIHVLALSFTRIADELGDARAANMVMLGALLEITGALPQASVDAALRRLVKSSRWLALDQKALARGRELSGSAREELAEGAKAVAD